jgi:hypothetical protein
MDKYIVTYISMLSSKQRLKDPIDSVLYQDSTQSTNPWSCVQDVSEKAASRRKSS